MKTCPNSSNFKFKKFHKFNINFLNLLDQKIFFLRHGQYGLQALEAGKLTFKQIEACRRTIRRGITKTGLLWIRVFTFVPVTKKSISSRMGKGKGNISYWIAPIKKGQILFEINSKFIQVAFNVLKKASTKLPFKTKVIKLKF